MKKNYCKHGINLLRVHCHPCAVSEGKIMPKSRSSVEHNLDIQAATRQRNKAAELSVAARIKAFSNN